MSTARRRDIRKAISTEVARWTGAAVSFDESGKHPKAVVAFGGRTAFMPFPATPGRTSQRNAVGDIRVVLRNLGAIVP